MFRDREVLLHLRTGEVFLTVLKLRTYIYMCVYIHKVCIYIYTRIYVCIYINFDDTEKKNSVEGKKGCVE